MIKNLISPSTHKHAREIFKTQHFYISTTGIYNFFNNFYTLHLVLFFIYILSASLNDQRIYFIIFSFFKLQNELMLENLCFLLLYLLQYFTYIRKVSWEIIGKIN